MHQNTGDHLDVVITEDSEWQAHWKQLVCLPTQRYDAPYGKVGNIFVGIFSVELDGVCARQWNTERVIFFIPLSFNAPNAFIILHKSKSVFCLDLTF